jgi:hypothetical protein
MGTSAASTLSLSARLQSRQPMPAVRHPSADQEILSGEEKTLCV